MAIGSVPPPDILIASAAANGSNAPAGERLLNALVTGRESRNTLLADLGNGQTIKLQTTDTYDAGTRLRLAVLTANNTARILTAVSPSGQRLPLSPSPAIPVQFVPHPIGVNPAQSSAAAPAASDRPSAGSAPTTALRSAPPTAVPTQAQVPAGSSTGQILSTTAPPQGPVSGAPTGGVAANLAFHTQLDASVVSPRPTITYPSVSTTSAANTSQSQGGVTPPGQSAQQSQSTSHPAGGSSAGSRPASGSSLTPSAPQSAPLSAPRSASQSSPGSAAPAPLAHLRTSPEIVSMIRQALPVQAPMAELFALAQGIVSASPNLGSEPIRHILEQLLGLQRPVGNLTKPALLKQAIAQSGPFYEASLVHAAPPASLDIKGQLLALDKLVRHFYRQNNTAKTSPTAPPKAGTHPAPAPAAAAPQLNLANAQNLLGELSAQTASALARVRLLQYAGLPASLSDGAEPVATSSQQWLGEIPVLINAKSVLLHFDIDREPSETSEDAEKGDVWTFRFSLDSDPDGPIHGKISLQGPGLTVALWAEDTPTAAALLAGVGGLKTSLAELGLEAMDVSVHLGRPADVGGQPRQSHEVDAQT